MALDIKVVKKENFAYSVELKGPVDTVTSPQLKKELEEIIDERTRAIVLDMAGVDYVSSKGLGVVVWAQKALKKANASFAMVNLQPQIKKLFDLMKLAPNIKIYDLPEGDEYIDQIIKDEIEKQNK
ncbi:MAG: STAS domain-containing protein [Planctomycetota bacterium]|jgi:anti-anti-sigma factor